MTPQQGLSRRQNEEFVHGVSGGAFATIFWGAIRSGKTFVWLLLLLVKVSEWDGSGRFIIVGKNRDAVFRNVFEELLNNPTLRALHLDSVEYTQGAPRARILGKTVHVIGANDDRAETRIRGMTVAYAFVDEVTVLPEKFFRQLIGRLSIAGAQLFGTTNPDSPAHWLKKAFLDRLHELPGWRTALFLMDDNPSLTDAYKAQQAAANQGLFYQRNILGKWVAAEGAIYDMWDVNRHVISRDSVPPLSHLVSIGIDYGTDHPSVAVLLGMTAERAPRLVVLDEWTHEAGTVSARWSDAQQSAGIVQWLADVQKEHGRVPWVFVDTAAASLRVQLKTDGVQTLGAEKDVLYGIQTLSSLLASGRLLVVEGCRLLTQEFPGYSWDPRASLEGESRPKKVADDALDALRYAVTTSENHWRQHIALDDTYRPREAEAA